MFKCMFGVDMYGMCLFQLGQKFWTQDDKQLTGLMMHNKVIKNNNNNRNDK